MRSAVRDEGPRELARQFGLCAPAQVPRETRGLARSGSCAVAGMPGANQRGRNRSLGESGKRSTDAGGFKCTSFLTRRRSGAFRWRIEQVVSGHLGPGRVRGNTTGPCFSRQVSMYLAKHVGHWSLSRSGNSTMADTTPPFFTRSQKSRISGTLTRASMRLSRCWPMNWLPDHSNPMPGCRWSRALPSLKRWQHGY